MKKFLKFFISIIIIILMITYLVCSIKLPGQTRWFMEQASKVLNYPISIAGISTTIGAIAAYFIVKYIMNMTKFGRRELDAHKKEIDVQQKRIEEFKELVSNKVFLIESNYKEFCTDVENSLKNNTASYNHLQDALISALSVIPNKRIQIIVKEYKDEKESNAQTTEE